MAAGITTEGATPGSPMKAFGLLGNDSWRERIGGVLQTLDPSETCVRPASHARGIAMARGERIGGNTKFDKGAEQYTTERGLTFAPEIPEEGLKERAWLMKHK